MQMKFLKMLVAAVLLASAAWAEARGACRTGVDWRHVGAGMGGNSYWLAVDPNDDQTLFYSPDVGGAYRSRDGGRTWKHLAVEFSHERRIGTWTLITIAPSDSRVVYVAASQRFCDYSDKNPDDAPYIARHGRVESGLIRSTDGGDTWESLYASPLRPGAIAVDPDDADTLWVAGPGYISTCHFGFRKTYDRHGEGWVAKSTDGGRTWKYVYAGCRDSADANARKVCYSSLLVDRNSPRNNRTLYLSGNGGGVWKSTDGGETWVTATNGLPTSSVGQLASSYGTDGTLSLFAAGCFSPCPESLYPDLRKSNTPGIYRSDDGGATWRDVSGNLSRTIGRYRITVSPTDKNVMYTAQTRGTNLAGEQKCVWKTVDGGQTWKKCMDYADRSNLAADRWNNHYSYLGSPDTFIAISPSHPEKLWFADAGCMMWESHDAGGHWSIITSDKVGEHRFKTRGMDNSFILSLSVSPKNRNFLLMCCHDFDFLSSVDGGETFFSGGQTGGIAASGAADGCFGFMSVCHDPHDPLRAYAGSKGWSASYSEGSVFLTTTDGGYTWHAPETNPKGMKLGSVADILSPESMKEVEARPGGGLYRKGRLMMHNWAIRHLAIDAATGRIFATKRTGVYYSDNKGGDWKRATFEGIGPDCDWAPNYVQIDPASGRVYAVASYLPIESAGLFSSLHINANGTVFDPKPDARGGLYVSDDHGATFRKFGVVLPEMILPAHFAVTLGGKTIYLGTIAARVKAAKGDRCISAGLWRSDDGGQMWTRVLAGRPNRLEGRVEGIAVRPDNPDVVYVAMREATVTPALAAILRTTDGGKTWKDISGAASHYTYTWLSLSGADPSNILVGTAGGGAYIGHDNDLAR